MKQDVFNQYVDKVTKIFEISKDDFFAKSKKREIVDARQLVYYLCSKRPMRIKYIQQYMEENGYKTGHSPIIHGIGIVSEKIANDRDYVTIIKEIDRAVFI